MESWTAYSSDDVSSATWTAFCCTSAPAEPAKERERQNHATRVSSLTMIARSTLGGLMI